MKAPISILTALSVATNLAAAQFSGLPTCGLTCAFKYVIQTGCTSTDIRCLCASNFITLVTPCAQKACSASDYDKVAQGAQKLCSASGVTVTIPSNTVSGTSSTTTSGTGSNSGSSTTTSTTTTQSTTTTTDSGSATKTTFGGTATATGTPSNAQKNEVTVLGMGVVSAVVGLGVMVGALLI